MLDRGELAGSVAEDFVAVLRRLLVRIVSCKPPPSQGLIDQVVWFVDRLAEFHELGMAVHERARNSEVVAEFHTEFQAQLRGLLLGALMPHVPQGDLELAADSFMATVEGLLLRGVPSVDREAVVRFTLERLTA